MKKLLLLFSFLLLLSVLVSGCNEKKDVITITTGGTGGTYYPVGGAIAQTISENIPYLTVNSQAGNASVANCILIRDGGTESALVQNNVAFWAYEGIGVFDQQSVKSLRAIAALYPEAIQIVALAKSGISSVEDLADKKVCVGEIGSGVYFDAINILNAYDMQEDDIQVEYLSFSEASKKLKSGELDAAFITAGYPTSSVIDVDLVREIVIVPIEDDKIQKMMKTSPYYVKTIIPAGTYHGIDHDVQTATTMAMWVVSADVDDNLVYDMTKALWEHRDEVESAHEKGEDITIETALDGIGIPIHPGALRYYEEIGMK